MGKRNKRKSTADIAETDSPKKVKVEQSPSQSSKREAVSNKVKIEVKSPETLKNKTLKTPIKIKPPKSSTEKKVKPAGNENGATKTEITKKLNKKQKKKTSKIKEVSVQLIPAEIAKNMSRKQKIRIMHKLKLELHKIGKTDFTTVNLNEQRIKDIIDKTLSNDQAGNKVKKSKVIKKIVTSMDKNKDEIKPDESISVKILKKKKKNKQKTISNEAKKTPKKK